MTKWGKSSCSPLDRSGISAEFDEPDIENYPLSLPGAGAQK